MSNYSKAKKALKTARELDIPLTQENLNTLSKIPKKKENIWWTIDHLMGYDPKKYRFIQIVGSGGRGKSYSTQQYVFSRVFKNPEHVHVYWCRLSDRQKKLMLQDNASKLLDAGLYKRFGKDLKTNGDTVYFGHYDIIQTKSGKEQRRFVREGQLCMMIDLSCYFNSKGLGVDNVFPETDEVYFVLDEAAKGETEANRFSVVENLTQQLETYMRGSKCNWRCIMISNQTGDNEISAHFNFFAPKAGIYKCGRKHLLVECVGETEDFHKQVRENSAAYMFNKNSSRFASEIAIDATVIAPKKLVRHRAPEFIMCFNKGEDKWFTMNNNNLITKYNKECKPKYSMQKYVCNELYDQNLVKQMEDLFLNKGMLFADSSTFIQFRDCLSMIKKR